MKLIYRVAVCGAAILAVAGSYAAQTVPAPATSSAGDTFHIQVNGVSGAQFSKVFRDADGKTIDAATFAKAVKGGGSFTPAIDPAKKVITLTLQTAAATGNVLATHMGEKFPDFHLPTVAHNEASSRQFAGKPTLVDFFFADCVGCIEELPALNAYATKHSEMNFLAITFDDAKTAEGFVRQRHFGWPVAYDGRPLIAQLGVTQFPTMLLLDAQGRVIASRTGSIPIEYNQPAKRPAVQWSEAEATQSQLQWIDHWVTSALAHKSSAKK